MKNLLWGLISIFFTLLVLVLLLWFRPSWWWNPQVAQWAQSRWFPEAQVDWDKIQLSVENKGFLEKMVSVSGKDFCFGYKRTKVCWDHLAVDVSVEMDKDPVWHLKNLEGKSREFLVFVEDLIPPDPNAPPPPFVSLHQQSQDIQKLIRSIFEELPETYVLEIPGFEVHQENRVFFGQLKLTPKSLIAKTQWDNNKAQLSLGLRPGFDFNAQWESPDIKVEARIQGPRKINPDLKIGVTLQSLKSGGRDFSQQILKDPVVIGAQLKVDPKTYLLELNRFSIPLGEYGKGLKVGGCKFKVEDGFVTQILVSCPKMQYHAAVKDPSIRKAQANLKLKETFDFDLQGELNEKVLRGFEEGLLAQFKASLKTIENDLIKLTGFAELEFLIEDDKLVSRPKDLDLTVEVPRFKKLEMALRGTTFALPSPLNAMGGNMQVSVKKVAATASGFQLGLKGLVDLKSKSVQAVKGSLTGTLSKDESNSVQPFLLNGEFALEKLYIQIPPFDPLRGFPPVTSDPRVTSGLQPFPEPDGKAKVLEKKSPLRWDVRLKTTSPTSVRLYYELVSPYVGFAVDAKLSGDGSTFSIEGKEPAKLTYLRREITLQRFKVTRSTPAAETMDVDLRLLYQATDYKIYIDVIGTVDKPTVKLSSEPSLSRSDIISVLIYNRTSDDLTRNQSESVGGADSAMKDKTLGLFGIWAFASTPIESISYDSATQSYRAQVALPGKVTLDIGTDWESVQNLSLRRQIGENLAIITSYEPGDGAEGLGDVFLQKEWSFE